MVKISGQKSLIFSCLKTLGRRPDPDERALPDVNFEAH
jgi:hypothetical protein